MNVNSNNNTRDREKWHEGRKQMSQNGAEIEDKWFWGWWGQSNLFTDVQSRSTCSQVAFVFIFFQLFFINDT